MIKRTVYLFISILVLIGLYFAGQSVFVPSQSDTPKQSKKGALPKVLVEQVQLASSARSFGAIATGWAEKSADVYSVVSEKVSKVLFHPQQIVKRNQLLVQLDDQEEQIALRLAQVQLQNTKSLLDRYKQAVGKGAVPQTQVDSAQADYDAARLAVDQARLAIANHQIRAPFDGVVGITDIDPGQRIGPETLITGIDSREIIYIDFEVPEAISGQLDPSALNKILVKATSQAVPGQTFDAKVVALDSRLNAEKRTLRVRANIDNTRDLLRPGMSFSVQMAVKGQMLAAVPEIALQWDRDGSYVWVIREAKAERVNAKVLDRRNGKVFVDGALQEKELVVVEGGLRLVNGVEVDQVEDPLK